MESGGFDIITFDCYGTLIDWEQGIVDAFQIEAARDGVEFAAEQVIAAYAQEEPQVENGAYQPYRAVLAETARRVGARLGWDINPDRADFLASTLPGWKPFADTN